METLPKDPFKTVEVWLVSSGKGNVIGGLTGGWGF